jgi:8-oxo-dGTP pyrophosphatase MutT (NUDIX family)
MANDINIVTAESACLDQFGALCWRKHRGRIEVLLITSRDTGRWVIPKGWAIAGLTASQTAAREAWEEAGVEGKPDEQSLGLFHYDKMLGPSKLVACAVQVFGLKVSRLAKDFAERKQRRRKWFDAEIAARKVNEPELRILLADLPRRLNNLSTSSALAQG